MTLHVQVLIATIGLLVALLFYALGHADGLAAGEKKERERQERDKQ